MKAIEQKLLLTIEDASKVLSLSKSKIRALIRSKELFAVRIGKHLRISSEELQKFSKRRK